MDTLRPRDKKVAATSLVRPTHCDEWNVNPANVELAMIDEDTHNTGGASRVIRRLFSQLFRFKKERMDANVSFKQAGSSVMFHGGRGGGRAPRRQLASKACRKAADTNPAPQIQPAMKSAERGSTKDTLIDYSDEGEDEDQDEDEDLAASAEPAKKKKRVATTREFDSDAERVRFVIGMQEFDGSFEIERAWELAAALGVREEGIVAPIEERMDPVVWATVLVLAWLEGRMLGEKEIWEMAGEKARDWLMGKGVDLQGLEASAKAVLHL